MRTRMEERLSAHLVQGQVQGRIDQANKQTVLDRAPAGRPCWTRSPLGANCKRLSERHLIVLHWFFRVWQSAEEPTLCTPKNRQANHLKSKQYRIEASRGACSSEGAQRPTLNAWWQLGPGGSRLDSSKRSVHRGGHFEPCMLGCLRTPAPSPPPSPQPLPHGPVWGFLSLKGGGSGKGAPTTPTPPPA